jgi:8-oxo-dGTP pyrophosphatase MutT (NUDIX family)
VTTEAKRLKKMPKEPLNIVCCLVFDKQDRILLLQRHSQDLGGGLWGQPGGRQEPNEKPEVTAIREVQEETGLNLREVKYLGKHELQMPHGVAHMKTFQAQVKGDEKIIIDKEEHENYRWFPLVNLLKSKDIIWGLPTSLMDFGLIKPFEIDRTLADGSQAILLELVGA